MEKTKLDGDDLVISAVQLGDSTPRPNQPQPAFGLNPLAYVLDNYSNALLRSYYNKRWQKIDKIRKTPSSE
jgi:hypothetical protein